MRAADPFTPSALMTHDLFIGITSWNSQLFLPACLEALRRTTKRINAKICVLDNCSEDDSAGIAKKHGAEVLVRSCTQPEALNILVKKSKSAYTLLIHADVILLNDTWFEVCHRKLGGGVVLISPEDIGCGPLTRPFGAGKPESSFMLFETKALKECRQIVWRRTKRIPVPRYEFDFSGGHVTHNIPQLLQARGMRWHPMKVHASNRDVTPFYIPMEQPKIWADELGYLRYGLGNFYSIDGIVTHYHNWYDRVISAGQEKTNTKNASKEFSADFIHQYSARFLSDFQTGKIDLPRDLSSTRTPQAL
jgi:glycosyltransferase involved in cell wall biosynthesis